MLNLTYFLIKYIFFKNAILSSRPCFIQIRVFRVKLSIKGMMEHIHWISLLLATVPAKKLGIVPVQLPLNENFFPGTVTRK